ncbi:MAG: sensor histidine kinase [Peptostreptococcaceae bacterium]|nr:sensor histidine kinase [Peptostreptococcaceae bacterium]MDY5738473.1 sensor histidine kinase [Anaerovoracaceae bacterium]SFE62865.1 two-component system, OmpR family, sensor histidine kinase BraS/BceS [Peptostreptococcaceae bacterium pGA-8]
MNKLIDYLTSELKIIIGFLLSLFVFGMIFVVGNLDTEYYILGVEILSFVLLLYLAVGRVSYRKRRALKQQLEDLEIANRLLQNQIINEKKDLSEYFLLWIHQIKTPITVSKLLLMNDEDCTEELRMQLFYIEEYSNMAMNYLKLKDRQADMDITEVELDSIIKALLKKYSMIFINKHITLQYETISAKVISDSKWLSILTEQIISNALKYTEKGEISIRYLEEKKTLTIKDTGIGIRSEDINKIFDRGYSGFNGRVNEKSSGLGLYMAKKIAEILNVEIKVSSEVNAGSSFSIIFKDNLTNL